MGTSREIICLHFGQAGIQIGDATWQTVTAEHNINSSGEIPFHTYDCWETIALRTFFHHGPNKRFIPRALIVDSEPTVVDEIRTGYFRNLFHPDLLITGVEDAANNFSRGFYTIGQRMLHALIDKCRYVVESCDNFQGFISYSGTGGGTGSGLFSLFVERAMVEYSGKMSIGSLIVPGKTMSNCVVDPYNTIMRLSKAYASEDLNFIVDNESLYNISKQLNIIRPTYHSINKIVTPVFSTVTAPIRFEGSLTGTLSEISTNLIPYPRINFPMMSYTPFDSNEVTERQSYSCQDQTMAVFDENNNLLSQNLSDGLFMSSILIYRGCHVVNDIVAAIRLVKKQKRFHWVDWCPTGFKITQTNFPAIHTFASNICQPPKSILMLTNHSSIMNILKRESRKFILLYRKRSYLHWYLGEGMEEVEFESAVDDIVRMKLDYQEILSMDMEKVHQGSTSVVKIKTHSSEDEKKQLKSNLKSSSETRLNANMGNNPPKLTLNMVDSTENDYTYSFKS